MSEPTAPEMNPPSPKPKPIPVVRVEGMEYYAELARRLEGHIREHVIGVQAKREIGYAVEILRQLSEMGE